VLIVTIFIDKHWQLSVAVLQPIRCSELPLVTNAVTKMSNDPWNLNSTVFYFCNEGYTQRGPPIITCQLVDGKGEWSDNPPICELPTQCMCYASLSVVIL